MDEITPYDGPLTLSLMEPEARRAYESWSQQKGRARRGGYERSYSSRDFIGWWLREIAKRPSWRRPTCGRKDHSRGYSFGNIQLEEQSENTAERNSRHGNPGRKHHAVVSFDLSTGQDVKHFASKVEAAAYHDVSEKTVYNHCMGRTKQLFKFGPTHKHPVGFRWKK